MISEYAILSEVQMKNVFQLWNTEYPINISYPSIDDFSDYLSKLQCPRHYLLSNENGLIGWAFDFTRDEETWFGLIIDSNFQKQGKGTLLLNHLKEKNNSLSGWVIDHNRDLKKNGESYLSPINFYRRQAFKIHPEIHLGFDKISAVKITWGRD